MAEPDTASESCRDTRSLLTTTVSEEGEPQPNARYRIGEVLGRGGMGLVQLAFDRDLGRSVALKTSLVGRRADEQQIARFLREARVTAQLDHPNIVPVHDVGRLPDGALYYTMKRVEGRTLRAILAAQPSSPDGSAGFGRVRMLNAFVQACAAVGYAHSKGVVHRDLSPENIMLGTHGEVYVMDWGISRSPSTTSDQAVTADGQVLGKPKYMSPEQALGRIADIDARSDVYSLGAILYEVLTLEPAFSGDTALAVLIKASGGEIVPPRKRAPDADIPEELERICLRALGPRESRHPTANELRADLEDFLEGARAREAADHHVARGVAEVARHTRARLEARRLWAQAREAARSGRPFDPVELKRPLWDLEQRAREADLEVAQSFALAASTFERALAFAPGHREARRQLAALNYARFEEAEREHDVPAALYFRGQVEVYDDGGYAEQLQGDATLSVAADPVAEVAMAQYRGHNGVLRLAAAQSLGRTPIVGMRLPLGSYLLTLQARGRVDTRWPVCAARNQTVDARVRLLEPQDVEEGMVHIPAGPFLFGGDKRAPGALASATVELPDYLIGRFPVTQGEFRRFIHDLAGRSPEEARRRVPRTETEQRPYWVERGGVWEIPDVDPDGDRWDERMPVVGVSYEDAEAYNRWMTERTGLPYRLPTEEEWEKAARGVDGRIFPWGDRFDATFCKMNVSRPGPVNHEPVGAFTTDESPYGVRDMAGGVREWVSSRHLDDPTLRVARGGGAGASELGCRLCYRAWQRATDVVSYFGFRIARLL